MAQAIECQFLRKSENGFTVIFIHGILGSALSWRNSDNDAFWPRLVFEDSELLEYGLYIFNYRADAFAGSHSIEDVAGKLFDYIADLFPNERGFVFVGHSMGGIVARTYVVNNATELYKTKKKIGVFLVASPSAGSFYANIVAWISPLYHSELKTLRSGQTNEWLASVDKRFIREIHNRDVDICGKELIEDSAPGALKAFLQLAQIVPPVSAAKYFPDPSRIELSDHFTIATPETKTAQQHIILRKFLREFSTRSLGAILLSRSDSSAPPRGSSSTTTDTPINWPAAPERRSVGLFVLFVMVIAIGAFYWRNIYFPTIDLVRTIDFTALECDPLGNKNDIVIIDDAYDVIFNLFRFKSYAKRADFMKENFHATVYDLNRSNTVPVPGKSERETAEIRSSDHDLRIVDSKMRAKWFWWDSHSTDQEGTAVTGGWNLRNLTVNYKLPLGTDVTEIVKYYSDVTAPSCQSQPGVIVCSGLYTRQKFQVEWKWNVWQGCKK
jgi:hypothetical protein